MSIDKVIRFVSEEKGIVPNREVEGRVVYSVMDEVREDYLYREKAYNIIKLTAFFYSLLM